MKTICLQTERVGIAKQNHGKGSSFGAMNQTAIQQNNPVLDQTDHAIRHHTTGEGAVSFGANVRSKVCRIHIVRPEGATVALDFCHTKEGSFSEHLKLSQLQFYNKVLQPAQAFIYLFFSTLGSGEKELEQSSNIIKTHTIWGLTRNTMVLNISRGTHRT